MAMVIPMSPKVVPKQEKNNVYTIICHSNAVPMPPKVIT